MQKGHLSKEQKEAILRKVYNRGNRSIKDIAEEIGISYATIYKWMRESAEQTNMNNSSNRLSKKTGLQRLNILVQFYSLPEEKRGEFCGPTGLC